MSRKHNIEHNFPSHGKRPKTRSYVARCAEERAADVALRVLTNRGLLHQICIYMSGITLDGNIWHDLVPPEEKKQGVQYTPAPSIDEYIVGIHRAAKKLADHYQGTPGQRVALGHLITKVQKHNLDYEQKKDTSGPNQYFFVSVCTYPDSRESKKPPRPWEPYEGTNWALYARFEKLQKLVAAYSMDEDLETRPTQFFSGKLAPRSTDLIHGLWDVLGKMGEVHDIAQLPCGCDDMLRVVNEEHTRRMDGMSFTFGAPEVYHMDWCYLALAVRPKRMTTSPPVYNAVFDIDFPALPTIPILFQEYSKLHTKELWESEEKFEYDKQSVHIELCKQLDVLSNMNRDTGCFNMYVVYVFRYSDYRAKLLVLRFCWKAFRGSSEPYDEETSVKKFLSSLFDSVDSDEKDEYMEEVDKLYRTYNSFITLYNPNASI